MQLQLWAKTLLYGDRWEDKLLFVDRIDDTEGTAPALLQPPRFPGRPSPLLRIGKAEFPKLDHLNQASARGQLLHFFANHELLAIELMALVLLKFPGAPQAFRAGIVHTIQEEQTHLGLYVGRMRELGVEFGDLPVSDYFWNAIKTMTSPLEFVTQMSLTLEQANLDFSLFYQRAVARVGDEKTATILERVYREEMGHVKHGLTWFNRWRMNSNSDSSPVSSDVESDWDAYVRLLPPPMTPRRAKGLEFSAESRRSVGFSERFIHELEVYTGSKGRPPVFWLFNPLCEAEIVRGKPGFSPSERMQRMSLDLEHLLMFLALESDVALVQELPRTDWLHKIQQLGFRTPEFRRVGRRGELPRETKIGGLEPWGWSPEPFERFKPWRDRLIQVEGGNSTWCTPLLEQENYHKTGIATLFSKTWSVGFLKNWLRNHPEDQAVFGPLEYTGDLYSDWGEARERMERSFATGEHLIAKAPWGTSGTQNKRILHPSEIDSTRGGWIRNVQKEQGAIILEPWLNKEADLSMQVEIRESSVQNIGIRRFMNGSRLNYRGTYLDCKLRSLPPEILRFLHSEPGPLERWREFSQALGAELRTRGYQGPAGIDALVWREQTGGQKGRLFLKPLVELNPRWTMGRVAIELEAHVLPGVAAVWSFLPIRELAARGLPATPREAALKLSEMFPPRLETAGGKLRLAEGILFTTDPEQAREVLTALAVGRAASFAETP